MSRKILVIGSTNMDFVVEMDEMPAVGETVLGRAFHQIPGGKGANQALACRKLGGEVCFLTAVGEEGLGDAALENLHDAKADLSYALRSKSSSTGMAFIYVNREGNNSIVVCQGANKNCDLNYLKKQERQLEEADLIMTQMEIPEESAYYALQRGKMLGKITILNPAPAPDKIPDEIYKGLTYLTPNETELAKLTGMPTDEIEEVEKAAERLLEKGVKNVLVTLGERGAMLCSRGTSKHFAAPKVRAVDTTAAGDTFHGAFAVRLLEGASTEEAITFANAAAALSVSRQGAQTSVPARQEVEKFLTKGEKT